jgi:putative protease
VPRNTQSTGSIELLAPARDLQCGLAAIDSGADAVYIGAPRFGARVAAGNTLQEIGALADYAHRFRARVYATLNTLLRDDEIDDAVALSWKLYESGVDGLILQDMGLLECKLPPLPIIASTQTHNHTPERVAFLEQVGFQRAILARELSLEEIRAIRKAAPSIELECFVHGALCVCYSGQCYLSYALGGRSGNRGECAQPCRKRYDLLDGNGRRLEQGHLLSIRDLTLTDYLGELLDAGVTSFKIEGRLKDARYVANVVAYYSARLNELGAKRSSSGYSVPGFTPDLRKTFNRGYTSYFLLGRKEKIGSHLTPKMVGEPVGSVQEIRGSSFVLGPPGGTELIRLKPRPSETDSLHAGDGLCFFTRNGELRGTLVNAVEGCEITPDRMDGIEPGLMIYRNYDREFMASVEHSLPRLAVREQGREPEAQGHEVDVLSGWNGSRKISVRFRLHSDLSLEAEDEDGNSATVILKGSPEAATKPSAALATIRRQLEKTGDTEFVCAGVDVDVPVVPFVPVSEINALRRDVLARLRAERAENRPLPRPWIAGSPIEYPEKELSYTGNVLNRYAAAFYKRHGVMQIEPAAESGLDMHGRRVMTTRYCLKYELGLCGRETGHLSLVDNEGHRLSLRFDCGRCEMHVYLE